MKPFFIFIFLVCLIQRNGIAQSMSYIPVKLKHTTKDVSSYGTNLVDSVESKKFKLPMRSRKSIIKSFDFNRGKPGPEGKPQIAYFYIGKLNDSINLIIPDKNKDFDFTNDLVYYSPTIKGVTSKKPIECSLGEGKKVWLYLDGSNKNRRYRSGIENELPLEIVFLNSTYKFTNGDSTVTF